MTDEEEVEYLELLEIEYKERVLADYHLFSKEYLWITDKKGDRIKLVQNNAQNELERTINDLRAAGKPPRIIILKGRQLGISTDTEGRMTHDTTTKKNRNGLVVAHRSDSTSALFSKTKYFYDNLDEDVKPLKQASNATELIFNEPTNYTGTDKGINSKIKIQTAGKSGIGRSDTFHYVHLSEFGFWEGSGENSPDRQLTGILQSVPNDIDTWVIIESTANGINEFKDEWDKAESGESGFTSLFLAWYNHEEYIREVHNPKAFIASLSAYEQWLYNGMGLDLERVAWWRHTLKTNCGGDINQMKQENPTTAEEAFIFSGTPVFDNDKIIKRIEELKTIEYKTGYFDFKWHNEEYRDYIIDESIAFIESNQKPWFRIYADVKDKYPYVIAGDTKGEGKDEYTAQIMDNTNSHRVATCQMQMNNSKPYAWQVYCAGRYYNNALVGIEMNFNTAPLEELTRLMYYNQYYREKPEGYHGEITKGKIGWKTDGITRPRMIDKEVFVINEYLHLIKDVNTLKQAITFVYDKNGRPDAMSGKHDDLLIADCILAEISSQQSTDVEREMQEHVNEYQDTIDEFNTW